MKGYRRAPKPPLVQEYWSDLEVVERGGCKVLGRPSNDTMSAVAHDYAQIEWQLREIQIVKEQKKAAGKIYGLDEIKRDFASERVLVFTNDADLQAALQFHKVAPIAAGMIARVTGLSPRTVLQYAKRLRIDGRNQRDVIRRRIPRRALHRR